MASDNKFIEEDFERALQLDEIYLLEKQRQIELEYEQWEAEQHQRKPAKIIVNVEKEEHHDK